MMIRTTRHTTQTCPGSGCGKPVDSLSNPITGASPKVGDIAVCLYCQSVLTIGKNLKLRLMTPAEYVELPIETREEVERFRTESARVTSEDIPRS